MELLAVVVFITGLLYSNAESPHALAPADCNDAQIQKDAGVALDLINKHRRDGYILSLLRVADAYAQHSENASVVYLTLDVVDTECHILSAKHWSSCGDRPFYRNTEFGRCKAVVYINQFSKQEKLYGYNCTMSPVPPQLYECKDCPVRIAVLEDVEKYKEEAKKILQKYNQESNQTRYFKLEKVQKIFTAIASRSAYVVEFTIKETSCLRTTVATDVSECESLHGQDAHMGFCRGRLIKDTKDPNEVDLNFCEIYNIPAIPPEGEDADCDDPDVFNAVDLAVKAHNDDQKDGNLFALRMILAARRTAGPGKNFHIKYQIAETSCPLRGSDHWQNCEFLPTPIADSGECSAEIHTDDSQIYSSVFQKCKITTGPEKVTRSHARCLGCWHNINRKSEELIPIMKRAIQLFNNESRQLYLFDSIGVEVAARQLVAGWKYKFDYWIKETNCSKAEFSDLTPDCAISPPGHMGSCHVESYVDYRNMIINLEQKCQIEVENGEYCAGCPKSIPTDSPQLKEPLYLSLEKYNNESNHKYFFRITNVTKATVQIVAGVMYRMEFRIKETNCSKAEVHKLSDNCTIKDTSASHYCRSSVWEQRWQKKVVVAITVSCSMEAPTMMYFRRPPGFTPFRKAAIIAQVSSTGAAHTAEEKLSDTEKPGRGHGHGHKHGHKKPKTKSSEELQEDAEKQDEILPTASDPQEQEEIITTNLDESFIGHPLKHSTVPPFSLFDRLPDLPEPPAPKCPGKPWNPIILPTTPLPDPRDFVLEDLLPGEGDAAEPQETASATIQTYNRDFDLGDALS
ncbi:kininogen-1 [Sceloporus undulatus]|nr:kininogen-1 [Sceloporus undulatus]